MSNNRVVVFPYNIDGTVLQRNKFIKDLGVAFDEKITFNLHISEIVYIFKNVEIYKKINKIVLCVFSETSVLSL